MTCKRKQEMEDDIHKIMDTLMKTYVIAAGGDVLLEQSEVLEILDDTNSIIKEYKRKYG